MPVIRFLFGLFLLTIPGFISAQILTLQEAINFTLSNNDRAVFKAEQNYLSAKLRHEMSLADYKPQISFSMSASRSQSRLLNDGDAYTSNSFNASPSLDMRYKLRTPLGSKTSVSLGYQSQINRTGRFYHSPSLNLSYTQPLSLAGIRSGHLDYITTQQGFLSSEMSYKSARESIILTVINQYFGLWKAVRETDQSRLSFESAGRVLEIAELKLRAGEISEFEVLNTRVQYQLSKDNFEVSQNNLLNQKRNFKRLLGDKSDRKLQLVEKINMDTVNLSLEETVARAFEFRLDAKQWKINLQLAELRMQKSLATAWPSLRLSSRYSLSSDYDTPYGNDLSRFPFRQWSVSAGISYTIIDGGVRSRSIQTAHISHNLEKKNFELYQEDIRLTMEEHLRTLEMNLKRMESLKINLKMAGESMKIAEMKFKQGSISTTEVESIRERYRKARRSIDSAKIAYITQTAQLAKDMGVLESWVKDLGDNR